MSRAITVLIVEQVRSVLERSGADPERLKLELTESVVLDNVAATIDKMHALKGMGVGFSMDDFGTGYSSLTYLKRLPLDVLKIDRAFVRDIVTDTNDAAIVQTILGMAKHLGIQVIAEGVETVEQLEFLKTHGCRNFQGYLFSRAIGNGGGVVALTHHLALSAAAAKPAVLSMHGRSSRPRFQRGGGADRRHVLGRRTGCWSIDGLGCVCWAVE